MVKVIHTTEEIKQERSSESLPVGFVPTMGNLHAGHISLLEAALKDHKVVYFSIFVNPKQFGPSEDFARYPRTLKEDIDLLEVTAGKFPNSKIVLYAPLDPAEVFPQGSEHTVSVEGLSSILEGEIRPGHFDGVTTVVHRLFELVQPERAYFGLKDYQQYVVIKKMVKDLALPVEVIGMPIVREETGLALSSRNQYLSSEQREGALILSRTLKRIDALVDGKRSQLKEAQVKIAECLKDKNWNYLVLRDADDLSQDISHSPRVVLLGVYQLGSTRLLDNLVLEVR